VSDYLLQVRVQNKPLTLAMRAAGYKSATAFSKACGISGMTISRYLNCQLSPLTPTGKWKIAVLQMSKRLSVLPEDLFPEQYRKHLFKTREIEIFLSLENMVDIGMLQPCDPPDVLMEMHESGRPLEVTRIIRNEPTKPPPPTLSSDAIVELLMQHAVKS
jgi:hypothetical protein